MQNDGQNIHPRSREGPVFQPHSAPSVPSPVPGGEIGPQHLPANPYLLSGDEIVQQLRTNPDDGLSDQEAESRLTIFGLNELSDGPGVGVVEIFLRQIFNAMSLVLILAMAVSFAIKSWIEAAVITMVVIVNIVIGFMQEYSAEKTMDGLRSLSSPTASVIRSGHKITIRSGEIVPGDIIEVKLGDTIPADARILEAMNFETDEALLTGESLPVAKNANASFTAADEAGVGDRINMAYSSSTVSKGRAIAVVVSTGMHTEIGKIAQSLRGDKSKVRKVRRDDGGNAPWHRYFEAAALTVKDGIGKFLGTSVGTPLQRKLSWLAIFLFLIAVVFAITCLAANKFSDRKEVILYAVGTGLSMIPASLVVVLTITMAVGTKIMANRNVIVRKLDSLEALGAVTDICSDKTGTLTQGRMAVKKAWVIAEGTYSVGDSGNPIDPTSAEISFEREALLDDSPGRVPRTQAQKRAESPWLPAAQFMGREFLSQYLNVATFCNLATVHRNRDTQAWDARGDPTEIAIQVFASRFDWGRRKFTSGGNPSWSEIAEYPFDSEVKRMTVVYRNNQGGGEWAFMKGAVERVLESCTTVQDAAGPVPLSNSLEGKILQQMEALASQGLRILALAQRSWTTQVEDWGHFPRQDVEKDMTLLGLIGLYDPPRVETAGAVTACHRAGINVHMLTGDHKQTARAIAIEVGILPPTVNSLSAEVISSLVMTAAQFDQLSDNAVDELPFLPLVIARCTPQTKVRMVEALHRRKRYVAMTGDGVNDSPALKRADVGIGMGLAGSDVAKNASDIVLTDDNFASILNSIEEGRRMFDNIKKFVLHLLAENIAQACTLLIGLAFKDSTGLSVFPLAPVEILWIIMITSSLPDMGLGWEPASPDVMTRPPHDLKVGIFTQELLIDLTVYGFWMAALCLSSFALVVFVFGDGNLGHGCNQRYSDDCQLVFRARTTTFTCLTWFALFLAWEMVHMRRSFFRLESDPKHPWTMWARHALRNRFLFWSIMAGFITVFPIIYVPGLNTVVFKHAPISWEWGIVLVETIMFFSGIELWKFCKRIYFRRYDGENAKNPETELIGHSFSRFGSRAASISDPKGSSDVEALKE